MKSTFIATLALFVSAAIACKPITGDVVYDCGAATDAFQVKSITLNPAKPQLGKKVNLALEGNVNQEITSGSVVKVTAKRSGQVVYSKDYDLCEYLSSGTHKCPIPKGPFTGNKDLDIIAGLPAGDYVVDTVATSTSNSPVFNVQFKFTL